MNKGVSNNLIAIIVIIYIIISISLNFLLVLNIQPHAPVTAKVVDAIISICFGEESLLFTGPQKASVLSGEEFIIYRVSNPIGQEQVSYTELNYFFNNETYELDNTTHTITQYNSTFNTSEFNDTNCGARLLVTSHSTCHAESQLSEFFTINNEDVKPNWTRYNNAYTTNLDGYSSWAELTNIQIGIPGVTQMDFSNDVINLDQTDLNTYLNISYNKIQVANVSCLWFIQDVRITFEGLLWPNTASICALQNGTKCEDCYDLSYLNGTFIFTTPDIRGEFSAGEGDDCTTYSPPTASGGGGGATGGGGDKTKESFTCVWDKLELDKEYSCKTPGNISFSMVNFSVKSEIKEGWIKINKIHEFVPALSDVFDYVSIETNIENMYRIKIFFDIDNNWLQTNGFTSKNVILRKYYDETWKNVPTRLLKNEYKNSYYRSTTDNINGYFGTSAIREDIPEGWVLPKNETTPDNKSIYDLLIPDSERPVFISKPKQRDYYLLALIVLFILLFAFRKDLILLWIKRLEKICEKQITKKKWDKALKTCDSAEKLFARLSEKTQKKNRHLTLRFRTFRNHIEKAQHGVEGINLSSDVWKSWK